MDLSSINLVTQKVAIIHPGKGVETGLIIEVASAESDPVKRVSRRHLDKALRSRDRKVTVEQLEERALELSSAAVVGWEWTGDASMGGKKLEFTPANVATVLKIGWIRSQVEEVMKDEAGFFTN